MVRRMPARPAQSPAPRPLSDQRVGGPATAERLEQLVGRAEFGLTGIPTEDLLELGELYRAASTEIARLEASDHDPRLLAELRRLVGRAHRVLYRPGAETTGAALRRAFEFLVVDSPAAIWAERKLLGAMLVLFYGLCLVAYAGVTRDLELAYALQDGAMIDAEIEQLRETAPGEPFRGNFTFGIGESSMFSGMILARNIYVSMLFFGAGLVPPLFLYILVNNALMVGTYTGVAGHWDQAGAISSILWCHGVIELQMIILAGAAGLVLARAWIAPGPWSRAHAMVRESRRAWAMMAPIFPLLTCSGFIEGYVSPHAPLWVRLTVGLSTGVMLAFWIANGVKRSRSRSDLRAASGG